MYKRFLFILNLVVVLLFSSCKSSESDPKIINGIYIDNKLFPVALLVFNKDDGSLGVCTATIISDSTVLTAAHCLVPQRKSYILEFDVFYSDGTIRGYEASPLYYSVHKKFKRNDTSTYAYDIATLTFETNTFEGINPFQIAQSSVKEHSTVFLAGYGCFTTKKEIKILKKIHPITRKATILSDDLLVCRDPLDLDTNVHKRIGENLTVKPDSCPSGMIQINQVKNRVDTSIENPSGTDSAPSPGDSGGPLFKTDGTIVGVISAVSQVLKDNRVSCFVDLTLKENSSFLKEALFQSKTKILNNSGFVPPVEGSSRSYLITTKLNQNTRPTLQPTSATSPSLPGFLPPVEGSSR